MVTRKPLFVPGVFPAGGRGGVVSAAAPGRAVPGRGARDRMRAAADARGPACQRLPLPAEGPLAVPQPQDARSASARCDRLQLRR